VTGEQVYTKLGSSEIICGCILSMKLAVTCVDVLFQYMTHISTDLCVCELLCMCWPKHIHNSFISHNSLRERHKSSSVPYVVVYSVSAEYLFCNVQFLSVVVAIFQEGIDDVFKTTFLSIRCKQSVNL